MIAPPERSPERDAAILALLPRVSSEGWTMSAARAALREAEADPMDADLLFPGGATDLVETYVDLADRRMDEAASGMEMASWRLPERVRAVIGLRLEQGRGERDAIRRALGVLAWPGNAAVSARTLARTVDAIWHAAGDRSADFSWYTKRAILAGVYGSTLLFWLGDVSLDDEDTLAFLDRRLDGVGRLGRLRRRVGAVFGTGERRPA